MAQVVVHVYDVTNSPDPKTNENILTINRVFKEYLAVGGIFHGAVEVNGDEWSYGYCPRGTGVFACSPKENPMYSYRESVVLGPTDKSEKEVKDILNKLKKEWPGTKYDLLKSNCNHFCEELCKELQVGPFPLWVNRLAHMGQTSLEMYIQASEQMEAARRAVSSASQSVYSYFFPQPAPGTQTVSAPANGARAEGTGGAQDKERHSSLDIKLPVFPTIDSKDEAPR